MGINLYTSNSNRKRFMWLRLIVFLAVLIYLLGLIGDYYEDISNENTIVSNYKKAWDEFYSLSPNSLDLVFIGSSHAYCTFDPELIDNSLGTNSFNFGSPLQHADSSYYVLKEILKYQKPEVVIFEIYWDMLDDEFELKQADTVINAIDNKEFEKIFVKDVFPINEIAKYVLRTIRFQQDVFAYWNEELMEYVEEYVKPINKPKEIVRGVSKYKSRGFIYSDIIIPEEKFYEKNQFRNFEIRF